MRVDHGMHSFSRLHLQAYTPDQTKRLEFACLLRSAREVNGLTRDRMESAGRWRS